jgi:hypothetical protein
VRTARGANQRRDGEKKSAETGSRQVPRFGCKGRIERAEVHPGRNFVNNIFPGLRLARFYAGLRLWFLCRPFNILCFVSFFGFLPLVVLFFLGKEADFEAASARVIETERGAGRLKSAHMMVREAIRLALSTAISVTFSDIAKGAV